MTNLLKKINVQAQIFTNYYEISTRPIYELHNYINLIIIINVTININLQNYQKQLCIVLKSI